MSLPDWTEIRDKRWADHICPEEPSEAEALEENEEWPDDYEEEENDDEDE